MKPAMSEMSNFPDEDITMTHDKILVGQKDIMYCQTHGENKIDWLLLLTFPHYHGVLVTGDLNLFQFL